MKFPQKYFCILLFVAGCCFSLAQPSKKDSLLRIFNAGKINDSIKIKLLNEISWELRTNKIDSALLVGKQSLALCEKTGQIFQKGIALHYLGVFSAANAKYDDAITYYQSALKIWDELEKKEKDSEGLHKILVRKEKTSGNLGNAYSFISDFAGSLDYFFKALVLSEKNKDTMEITRVLSGIGASFTAIQDYASAQKYYERGLKICEKHPDKSMSGIFYGNMGTMYSAMKKHTLAKEYFNKALSIAAETGDKKIMARHYNNIGNTLCDERNYKLALQYYALALPINEEMQHAKSLSNNYTGMGIAFLNLTDYGNAEKNFLKSLKIAEHIKIPEMTRNLHEDLSRLYDSLKKFDKAFFHYKMFVAIRDSIFSEDNTKKEVQIQMQYEFDKKESEAKTTQEKKDLMSAEEKRKQQLILWFTVGGLLVVVILAGIILRSLILNKRKNKIISEQKELVEKQKHVVEEKQKEILDSIRYAKRIQTALIASEKSIDKMLGRLSEKK